MVEGRNPLEWKLIRNRTPSELQKLVEDLKPSPSYLKHTRTKAIESLLHYNYEDKGYLLCEGMIVCSKRWGRDLTITQYRNQLEKVGMKPKTYSNEEWRINTLTNPNLTASGIQKLYLNDGKNCQSLWCKQCRLTASQMFEIRVRKRLQQKLVGESYTNADFKHITGIVGVCDFEIEDVEKLLSEDNLRWRRMRRRLQSLPISLSPFIESAYEFELVDWDHLKESDTKDSIYKKKQMETLIEWYQPKTTKLIFVHFHSVTNLNTSDLFRVVGDEYWINGKPLIKTHKQVGWYIQSFHKDKDLNTNIKKVCSYPFKSAYRYKHSYIGSDYTNGEYIHPKDLSKLILLYQHIQKRSWRGLLRSIEHPIAVDIATYRDWYPRLPRLVQYEHNPNVTLTKDSHPVWSWLKEELPDGVIIVDRKGIAYPEGWNPNLILKPDESTYGYRLSYQQVIRKEFFQHPDYPWVTAYKNVWGEYQGDVPIGGVKGKPLPALSPTLNFDQFFSKQNKKVMDRHLNKTKFKVGNKYHLEHPSQDWRGLTGYQFSSLVLMGLKPPPSRDSLFKPTFRDDQSKSIPITSAEGQRLMKDVQWIEETSKFLNSMKDTKRAKRLGQRLKLRQLDMEKRGYILTII